MSRTSDVAVSSAEADRWVQAALVNAHEWYPDVSDTEMRGPLEQAFDLASRTARGEREFHAVFEAELQRSIEEMDVIGSSDSVLPSRSGTAALPFHAIPATPSASAPVAADPLRTSASAPVAADLLRTARRLVLVAVAVVVLVIVALDANGGSPAGEPAVPISLNWGTTALGRPLPARPDRAASQQAQRATRRSARAQAERRARSRRARAQAERRARARRARHAAHRSRARKPRQATPPVSPPPAPAPPAPAPPPASAPPSSGEFGLEG